MSEPLVTVLCITYNQAMYVRDMMDGLLRQKTDFEVEYIIHDDASTDGTQQILKEYEESYPGVFKIIYQKENQWSKGIKITQKLLVPLIRGRYVAFCEGDDFWIDSNKLQEQVDFLEAHPDYSCVAHNALKYNVKTENIVPFNTCETSRTVTGCEIVDRKFPYLATASKMHRKDAFILNDFFLESGEIGDVCTDYYALTKGKIYYIDKIMSVYRFRSLGSYSERIEELEHSLRQRVKFYGFLSKYNEYTNNEYKFYIGLYMSRTLSQMMDRLLKRKLRRTDFKKLLQTISEETNHQYDKFLQMIERVSNILVYGYDEGFCNEMKNLSKTKTLYIYGAGDYGMRIANMFMNHDVLFEGFVVSNATQNDSKYLGKRIFDVTEFAKVKEQAELIISLDVVNWEDVRDGLRKLEIDNYICPVYIEPISYEK